MIAVCILFFLIFAQRAFCEELPVIPQVDTVRVEYVAPPISSSKSAQSSGTATFEQFLDCWKQEQSYKFLWGSREKTCWSKYRERGDATAHKDTLFALASAGVLTGNEQVRRIQSVEILGFVATDTALNMLKQCLGDSSLFHYAIHELLIHKWEEVAPLYMQHNPLGAVYALGHDPRGAPYLQQALNSEWHDVRRIAARLLAEEFDQREGIDQVYESATTYEKLEFAETLRQCFGDSSFVLPAARLLALDNVHASDMERSRAIRAIGKTGYAEDIDILSRQLENGIEGYADQAALEALSSLAIQGNLYASERLQYLADHNGKIAKRAREWREQRGIH